MNNHDPEKVLYYGFFLNTRMVATPCPHKGEHAIKIGSLYCQGCEHHLGQDMNMQVVWCNLGGFPV